MQRKHVVMLVTIVALTVALGLALSLTRAGRRPVDGRIELTLGRHFSVKWIKPFQALCDEFSRENPRVRATVVGIPGSYYEKVLVMMAGRTAPDLVWMGQGFAQFASRGAFLDVEDDFDIDPADYYMQVVNCYRFDGRLQGFPYAGDFTFVLYNADIFAAAGIDPPCDNWTLDAFRHIARRLTVRDASGRVIRWGYRGQIDPGAFGAYLLTPDMTRHQLNEPQWLDYFKFALAMKYEDRSMPSQSSFLTDRLAFMQEKVAMIAESSYMLPQYRQTIRDIDIKWDIVSMPRGVRPSSPASTQGFAIWKHTRHPKQAIQLLKFLVSPAAQEKMWDLGVPSHRATARRYVENLPSPPTRGDVMLQSMEFLNPAPRHPRLYELLRAFEETHDLILERKQPPEQALRSCAKQLAKILSRQYVSGR